MEQIFIEIALLVEGICMGSLLAYVILNKRIELLREERWILMKGWGESLKLNVETRLRLRSYEETIGIRSPLQYSNHE